MDSGSWADAVEMEIGLAKCVGLVVAVSHCEVGRHVQLSAEVLRIRSRHVFG